MILIDSNVIIDIFGPDPSWRSWSVDRVNEARTAHVLAINPVIIAEVAPGLGSLDRFHAAMASIGAVSENISDAAAFLAGQTFQHYRRNRGADASTRPLPDFFIGAHAMAERAVILTRDTRFYRRYFPDVALIAPDQA